MRKRLHLKRKIKLIKFKKKKSKKNIIICTILLIIITIIFCFKVINSKLVPVYMDYATVEAKKIGSVIINDAVNDDVFKNLNYEDMLMIDKNEKNEVIMIDFNPIVVNKLLNQITNNIQNNYKKIDSGKLTDELSKTIKSKKKGVIYEMPSGIVFDSVLLKNLGPKIPVKIDLEGDILTNINTKVSNYGINNALIEISVLVEMNQKVILPVSTKEIKVKSSIPLFIKLVQGTVPNYLGTIDRNSSYYNN